MDGIVLLLVWIPKIALVVTPLVLVARSRATRGVRKTAWIAVLVAAYYLAPIPANIYARDVLVPGESFDFEDFMTVANLEYVCIVVVFWAIYLCYRLVTRTSSPKGGVPSVEE